MFEGSVSQRRAASFTCRKVAHPAPDTLRQLAQEQLLDITIPAGSSSKATSPQRHEPVIMGVLSVWRPPDTRPEQTFRTSTKDENGNLVEALAFVFVDHPLQGPARGRRSMLPRSWSAPAKG